VIRVASVGPTRDQSGGMAAVVAELQNCAGTRDSSVSLLVLDSGGLGGSLLSRFGTFMKCIVTVAVKRPDIVHLHVASRGSTWRKLTVAAVCLASRVRYGIHLHGAAYESFLSEQPEWRLRLIRKFFVHAAYVVVLGKWWSELVIKQLGVPAARVHVVHNGVAGDQATNVTPEGKERLVVFLGRLERLKGVTDLLSAWSRIVEPNVKLVIAGPSTDDSTVQSVKYASAISGGRISLVGEVTRDESLSLLRKAWVVVLPSYAEGLPMALIEAMSFGVPCVATRVGAVDELVEHGVNGYLIQPGDVEGLRRHLADLLSVDSLRANFSDAAYDKWCSGFRASSMSQDLHAIWISAAA
jgi:glycosyltransferase involved in cell wall biosynthesis